MAQFPVNTHRIDPYTNFKFQVMWDHVKVAGLSKMSAIKRTAAVVEWREAGGPSVVRKLPGPIKHESVTFEAGLSHDRQFLNWANMVNSPQGDGATSPLGFRKEVTILVLNMQGETALAVKLSRAWVSEFQILPEMDANANAVAIQTLKIEYEGFELDDNVKEPAES